MVQKSYQNCTLFHNLTVTARTPNFRPSGIGLTEVEQKRAKAASSVITAMTGSLGNFSEKKCVRKNWLASGGLPC